MWEKLLPSGNPLKDVMKKVEIRRRIFEVYMAHDVAM